MARTTQSKILAISSNPETIMLLLIVGELWDPEVQQVGVGVGGRDGEDSG